MNSIRFVLLGCGRISYKHIEAISQLPGAVLAAVCDVDESKARAVSAKAGGVPVFTDYRTMLNSVEADVVSILTPSGYHAQHCITIASEFKKHIIVEKPMALRLQDGYKMIETCRDAGVRLYVVKQNRYNLPVQKLREALEAGRFGKLVMGTVRVRWSRSQEYYDQDAWRGTWALDGGVFTNQASHHIDLLEWMMGNPVSVMAKTTRRLADIEAEDTGIAVIEFESGAIGVVEATTAVRPKDLEGSLSILGERASVVIGGFAVNTLETWNFSDASDEENNKIIQECSEEIPNIYGWGHKRYYEEVLKTLREDAPVPIDGNEGIKSLKLINAIYVSAHSGTEVRLDSNPSFPPLGQC